jgi:colicin import membrane protein
MIFMPESEPRRFTLPSAINVSLVSFPGPPDKPPGPQEGTENPEPGSGSPPPPSDTDVQADTPEEKPKPKPEPVVEKTTKKPPPEPVALQPENKPEPKEKVYIKDTPEEVKKPKTTKPTVDQPVEQPVAAKKPKILANKTKEGLKEVITPEEAAKSSTDTGKSIKAAVNSLRKKLEKEGTGNGDGEGTGEGDGTGKPGGKGKHGKPGGTGGGGSTGPVNDIYRAQIKYQIEKNWAFSENLGGKNGKITAWLGVRILPDGKIADVWFDQKSGNDYLDDSAYRAIIKSNPLPPPPPGYTEYTVGLVFTPSGLK